MFLLVLSDVWTSLTINKIFFFEKDIIVPVSLTETIITQPTVEKPDPNYSPPL
jgi:hypothetical protein